MNTYIEIHAIQTVPPSNLNRDDTGSPKTAIYGGVQRAQVTSQSWKNAMRNAFPGALVGIRSRVAIGLIAKSVIALDPRINEADHKRGKNDPIVNGMRARELAGEILELAGVVKKGKGKVLAEEGESPVLEFLSGEQIAAAAALAVDLFNDVKVVSADAKTALNAQNTADIAFFGRMFANSADLKVNAAAQVAPALSVHAAYTEYDFFTAVGDVVPEGQSSSAADMMGTTEFNSSTLYRYTNLNLTQLRKNLAGGSDDRDAVEAFLKAFVSSMPSGKQNSYANRTLPEAVLIVVRDGQPVSLVGAFEEAVTNVEGKSRAQVTSERLASEYLGVKKMMPAENYPKAAYLVWTKSAYSTLAELDGVTNVDSISEAFGNVLDFIGAAVENPLESVA